MSRSNKTFSPGKENLLLQHLAKLERSPSVEDSRKFGSQCSINLDNNFLDMPTEPKRRRFMVDDSPSISSQVSSQMSSRSHSPLFSEYVAADDSLMSTPSASPTGTLKEHFRRKYRKDELWAAIETNYKYLMDKGIIEACQTTESEGEEAGGNSNKVSFGEFLQQYKEVTSWLKTIQTALQQKRASSLALSEKYLNQSYYEEIERSPRLSVFNDYAGQLKLCQPVLSEEVDVFLREVNTQWAQLAKAVAPTDRDQDPQSMLRDLDDDLECLKQWLSGVEGHLRFQSLQDWPNEELEPTLADHKHLQQDIESHSRIVSAILKLSERLQQSKNALAAGSLEFDTIDVSAHNLERRWHNVWLQSLEWQCRLEDAIARKTGIYNTGPCTNFTDDEYDPNDVTSSGDDSFHGLSSYRGDFIQSPPHTDISSSLSPDFDKSSGKDSAVASETELKTNSDMSENYQDLSVSASSDSDREFLRQNKVRNDSKDIGYGSESQSDDLESRYRGITFSGISGKGRKSDFYATVAVDTESTDKTDGSNSGGNAEPATCGDESDISLQIQAVLRQDESEMEEDIQVLIDQADIMVQKGNSFNKTFAMTHPGDGDQHKEGQQDGNQSSSSLSGPQREMVDKGVGTVESSCDASDEESGESDAPVEEFSVVTDDGTETIDSVIGSEYTSDEMKNGSKDYTNLPKLYDTNSLRARVRGKSSRERPWSVVELPNVAELHPISASESAIDALGGAHSDSDITATTSTSKLSQSLSPTFPRHRNRRIQRISTSSSSASRSQVGAKRKLNLDTSAGVAPGPVLGLDSISIASSHSKAGQVQTPPTVHSAPSSPVKHVSETQQAISETHQTFSETHMTISESIPISGNTTIVPLAESCTSEDEDALLTPMPCGNDLIHTLQNARFRSSGSSYDDTDTQGELGGRSEPDDPTNDGSFSENAWDNYQAPLYPTGSEDPPEDPLHWEPGEMEFDDEFSLPQSTILATLIARRSDDEGVSNKHLKLVPSSQGNFDDSDSDIEDLHHVLEESRMQLKVADRSLRKKRKDPLKTGLYLNPGKYGELLATIETNIKCLEAISPHLDPAGVSENDIQTIQDLLYQWEKLHALASERRNQSQELKTMYATLLSVEGVALEGVPDAERTRFRNTEQLKTTILHIQERQKLLMCQSQMLSDLHGAVTAFSSQNPSVNMDGFLEKIEQTGSKLEHLNHSCASRLAELEHIAHVWHEYVDMQHELEFLLSQEREIIERLAFSQEMDIDGYKAGVEADLQKLVGSLALYEEKLVSLQRLRQQLMSVSDEESQLELTAGLADIRNQLLVAQKLCSQLMAHGGNDFPDAALRDLERELDLAKEEEMEVEESEMAVTAKPEMHIPRVEPVKTSPVRMSPRVVVTPKRSPDTGGWLKSFPLQAVAFAVFLGLLYLFAPGILHRFLDFSLKINPELNYVNGAPPV